MFILCGLVEILLEGIVDLLELGATVTRTPLAFILFVIVVLSIAGLIYWNWA